jgi:hypothetical protein
VVVNANILVAALLFGDLAMGLKVPLPRRVSGVAAEGVKNGVSLTWQAALDCNGIAVSGYNLRSLGISHRARRERRVFKRIQTSFFTAWSAAS